MATLSRKVNQINKVTRSIRPVEDYMQLVTNRRIAADFNSRNYVNFELNTTQGITDLWEKYDVMAWNGTTNTWTRQEPQLWTNRSTWDHQNIKLRMINPSIKLFIKNNGATECFVAWTPWKFSKDWQTNNASTLIGINTVDIYGTSTNLTRPWVPIQKCTKGISKKYLKTYKTIYKKLLPGQEWILKTTGPSWTESLDLTYNKSNYARRANRTFGGFLWMHGAMGQTTVDDLEGDGKAGWMDAFINVIEVHNYKYQFISGNSVDRDIADQTATLPATLEQRALVDAPKVVSEDA